MEVRAKMDGGPLGTVARPFTRCLRCNGALEEVALAAAETELPPKVRARVRELRRCAGCGKLYWAGTHHDRMGALIARVLPAPPRSSPE